MSILRYIEQNYLETAAWYQPEFSCQNTHTLISRFPPGPLYHTHKITVGEAAKHLLHMNRKTHTPGLFFRTKRNRFHSRRYARSMLTLNCMHAFTSQTLCVHPARVTLSTPTRCITPLQHMHAHTLTLKHLMHYDRPSRISSPDLCFSSTGLHRRVLIESLCKHLFALYVWMHPHCHLRSLTHF